MEKPLNFEASLAESLPETYALIMSANLMVHPSVSRLTLHGSRGLAGGYRRNSDLDVSLIVEASQPPNMERLFQEVLETTLNQWQAEIELDLAVIFDIRNCKLACFEQTRWFEDLAAPINQISYISLNEAREKVIFYLFLTSRRYNHQISINRRRSQWRHLPNHQKPSFANDYPPFSTRSLSTKARNARSQMNIGITNAPEFMWT
jgi:hypothetical protein